MRAPALLVLPLTLLAAACGSSSSSSHKKAATSTPAAAPSSSTSASVKLATRTLPRVGAVLVNAQGRTLYVFAPDKAKSVTCTGGCASIWPPLSISSGEKASVSGAVKASLVSSDPNPSGGRVVTYAGWPLYLYVADPTPGTDHGQGISSSGGLWYVISPSGKVVGKTSGGDSGSSGGSNPY